MTPLPARPRFLLLCLLLLGTVFFSARATADVTQFASGKSADAVEYPVTNAPGIWTGVTFHSKCVYITLTTDSSHPGTALVQFYVQVYRPGATPYPYGISFYAPLSGNSISGEFNPSYGPDTAPPEANGIGGNWGRGSLSLQFNAGQWTGTIALQGWKGNNGYNQKNELYFTTEVPVLAPGTGPKPQLQLTDLQSNTVIADGAVVWVAGKNPPKMPQLSARLLNAPAAAVIQWMLKVVPPPSSSRAPKTIALSGTGETWAIYQSYPANDPVFYGTATLSCTVNGEDQPPIHFTITSNAYDEWTKKLDVWSQYIRVADGYRAQVISNYNTLHRGYLKRVQTKVPAFNKAWILRMNDDNTQAVIAPKSAQSILFLKDVLASVVSLKDQTDIVLDHAKLLKAYANATAPIDSYSDTAVITKVKEIEELDGAVLEAFLDDAALFSAEAFGLEIPLALNEIYSYLPPFATDAELGYRPLADVLDDIQKYDEFRNQHRKAVLDTYKALAKVPAKIKNMDSWIHTIGVLLIEDIKKDDRLTDEEKGLLQNRIIIEGLTLTFKRYFKTWDPTE